MKIFVDANIFLRFLLRDHPVHSPSCKAFFELCEKKNVPLITHTLVIAEIVWVLTSVSHEKRKDIVQKLKIILLFSQLEIPDRDILTIAIEVFEKSSIDFIDAYVYVWLKKHKITHLYSYDRDFDRIEKGFRKEP